MTEQMYWYQWFGDWMCHLRQLGFAQMPPGCVQPYAFFFLRTFLAAWRSTGTKLFYWAASRHRLFLYWPVSRCAWGREGISPDLPLPGWQATGWHGGAGVGKEVAEGWEISVQVVVGREVFKQQAGSEGRRCGVGEESGPPGHKRRTGGCLEWRGAGAGSGVGKHADEVGRFIAPPASDFDAKDDQAASSVLQQFWISSFLIPPGIL